MPPYVSDFEREPGTLSVGRPVRRPCWAQGVFPRHVQAVRTARAFTADTLARWGLPKELSENVEVCVSEAATNVLLHAVPASSAEDAEDFDVSFDMLRTEAELRVHVGDGDRERVPVLAGPDPEGTSGRGLLLITSLAHDFTVVRTDTGKIVSFSFDVPGGEAVVGAAS